MLSCVQLFAIPWTVAYQAPPSMEFSRQEYWSGFPFPSPGDLPDLGIEPRSPALQTHFTVWATREALHVYKQQAKEAFHSGGRMVAVQLVKLGSIPGEKKKRISYIYLKKKGFKWKEEITKLQEENMEELHFNLGTEKLLLNISQKPEAIKYWWSAILLLLLRSFSCAQLCATPKTAAHQVPPSLGFSRQEHWSGLPFPSPMHESESHSVMSDSSWSHGLQPTRLLCPWDFPGKSTGVGCHCLLRWSAIDIH